MVLVLCAMILFQPTTARSNCRLKNLAERRNQEKYANPSVTTIVHIHRQHRRRHHDQTRDCVPGRGRCRRKEVRPRCCSCLGQRILSFRAHESCVQGARRAILPPPVYLNRWPSKPELVCCLLAPRISFGVPFFSALFACSFLGHVSSIAFLLWLWYR